MSVGSPLAQSIQTRLVRAAKDLHVDPNFLFSRYAAERLLHRLASSRHAERFVLKGAMMLVVWMGDILRPTRDVDLLGFGDLSDEAVVSIFQEIASTEVEPDGVVFDAAGNPAHRYSLIRSRATANLTNGPPTTRVHLAATRRRSTNDHKMSFPAAEPLHALTYSSR